MALTRPMHPASVRRKLTKAGLSENTELVPTAKRELEAADPDLHGDTLRDIAQGKRPAKLHVKRERVVDKAIAMLAERGAMHYKDLWDALAAGGVESKGQTPAQTLSAALSRDDRAERVAPGVYKAKEA